MPGIGSGATENRGSASNLSTIGVKSLFLAIGGLVLFLVGSYLSIAGGSLSARAFFVSGMLISLVGLISLLLKSDF